MKSTASQVVIQLPRQYRDHEELEIYAIKMRDIRLKGLADDPQSFSSSLAQEIDQPIDFWTIRLTHPEARHFVICVPNEDTSPNADMIAAVDSTWIATLVLFGPRTIDLETFEHDMSWKHFSNGKPKPAQLPLEGSNLMYYISAVYVDSGFRRQGLGRKLSLETINAIRSEVQKVCAARAVCMIGADQNNTSALNLYQELGFQRLAGDDFTAQDGRKIVGIPLRLDIER